MQRLQCQGPVLRCLQKWTAGSDRSHGAYVSKRMESYKMKTKIISSYSLKIRGKDKGGKRGQSEGKGE